MSTTAASRNVSDTTTTALSDARRSAVESSTSAHGLGSGKLDVLRSMAQRIKALERYDRDSTALFTELKGKHSQLKRSHRELAQNLTQLKEVLYQALLHLLSHAPRGRLNATELRWALDQVDHLHQLLADQKQTTDALALQLNTVKQQLWLQFAALLFLLLCFPLLYCIGPPNHGPQGDLNSHTGANISIDASGLSSPALARARQQMTGAVLGATCMDSDTDTEGSEADRPSSSPAPHRLRCAGRAEVWRDRCSPGSSEGKALCSGAAQIAGEEDREDSATTYSDAQSEAM